VSKREEKSQRLGHFSGGVRASGTAWNNVVFLRPTFWGVVGENASGRGAIG